MADLRNACSTGDFLLFKLEKVRVQTIYFGEWNSFLISRWLPIMRAYGNNTPAYFGTPPVNLIQAYHASLTQITASSPSLQERYRLHQQVSQRIKAIASQLGLKQIPRDSVHAANGMTAVRLLFSLYQMNRIRAPF